VNELLADEKAANQELRDELKGLEVENRLKLKNAEYMFK
jgi:hypothetical protein